MCLIILKALLLLAVVAAVAGVLYLLARWGHPDRKTPMREDYIPNDPPNLINSLSDIAALIKRGQVDGTPWSIEQVHALATWGNLVCAGARCDYACLCRAVARNQGAKSLDAEADDFAMRQLFGLDLLNLKAALGVA